MITILLPVHDHSDYLERALHYYARLSFDGTIWISDASGEADARRNQELTRELGAWLDLRYHRHHGQPLPHPGICLLPLLDEVSTPWAVVCSAQDLLVPSGLKECAKFLENNLDYAGAIGLRAELELAGPGPWSTIKAAYLHQDGELVGDDSLQRWRNLMQLGPLAPPPLRRVKSLRIHYRAAGKVPGGLLPLWLTAQGMAVLEGKIKRLDCLYIGREQPIIPGLSWDGSDCYQEINAPHWPTSFASCQEVMIEALLDAGAPDRPKAEALFLEQAWLLIVALMGLQQAHRFSSQGGPPSQGKDGLRQMLHHSFPGYADFKRICQAVLTLPPNFHPRKRQGAEMGTTKA